MHVLRPSPRRWPRSGLVHFDAPVDRSTRNRILDPEVDCAVGIRQNGVQVARCVSCDSTTSLDKKKNEQWYSFTVFSFYKLSEVLTTIAESAFRNLNGNESMRSCATCIGGRVPELHADRARGGIMFSRYVLYVDLLFSAVAGQKVSVVRRAFPTATESLSDGRWNGKAMTATKGHLTSLSAHWQEMTVKKTEMNRRVRFGTALHVGKRLRLPVLLSRAVDGLSCAGHIIFQVGRNLPCSAEVKIGTLHLPCTSQPWATLR